MECTKYHIDNVMKNNAFSVKSQIVLYSIVGKPQLMTFRLLSTHYPCINWQRSPSFAGGKMAIDSEPSKSIV